MQRALDEAGITIEGLDEEEGREAEDAS